MVVDETNLVLIEREGAVSFLARQSHVILQIAGPPYVQTTCAFQIRQGQGSVDLKSTGCRPASRSILWELHCHKLVDRLGFIPPGVAVACVESPDGSVVLDIYVEAEPEPNRQLYASANGLV